MSESMRKFLYDAEIKAFDLKHRATMRFNISRYNDAVPRGKLQYTNLELAKQRASNIKTKVINDLENFLKEFETNFIKNGGKIIWANSALEATDEIGKILNKAGARKVVKSKSMVTEEIELNDFLKSNGIKSLETDLGEFIVQVADQKPYHIVTPAMHMSKTDVATLFNEKFGTNVNSTPEELTAYVRDLLRKEFVSANAGISGVNFMIADTGSLALTENEGNGMMSISFPDIHIAICGIEKVIPSFKDLALFWPLLATHGTGQNISVYNSIISGPRKSSEKDGPKELYLVLLDNGRTNLLSQKDQKLALTCIRCGACLNGCPIYKNIGGHAYGTVYSGPIGSVITPHMSGMKEYKHLSFASSLCGKCTDVCPVKIKLHKLLLYNRRDSVKLGYSKFSEKIVIYGWKKAMTNRWMLDKGSAKIKNRIINIAFKKAWGPRREIPQIAPKSFNRMWREMKGLDK